MLSNAPATPVRADGAGRASPPSPPGIERMQVVRSRIVIGIAIAAIALVALAGTKLSGESQVGERRRSAKTPSTPDAGLKKLRPRAPRTDSSADDPEWSSDASGTVPVPVASIFPREAGKDVGTVPISRHFLLSVPHKEGPSRSKTHPGRVTATKLGDTTWALQQFPLTPIEEGESCYPSAIDEDFRFKTTYTTVDRMNDRSIQEPSFRFVHLARPLPDQESPIDWPNMQPRDKEKACAREDSLRPETLPKGGCDGSEGNELINGGPWCNPWHSSVFIGELSCGFMVNSVPHGDMAFMVVAASGAVMSHKKLVVTFPPDAPLQEYESLATPGYTEYADAPGHFANELLGRLLHLDRFLPVEIPMVWPTGSIPETWLSLLREEGLISKERHMVMMSGKGSPAFVRAKRLYFYGTTEHLPASPVVLWFTQRMLNSALSSLSWVASAAPVKPSILILQRPGVGSRSMSNEGDVLNALGFLPAEDFSLPVVRWTATADNLRDTMKAIHGADIILGVHGANLGNIMFAREGSAVVEIGFLQSDFHLPSDYLCLGRNLGLHYWTVFPKSGGYGGQMEVDVEGLVEAVKAAGAKVRASKGEI
jgi:Glycosyltransferase 61